MPSFRLDSRVTVTTEGVIVVLRSDPLGVTVVRRSSLSFHVPVFVALSFEFRDWWQFAGDLLDGVDVATCARQI